MLVNNQLKIQKATQRICPVVFLKLLNFPDLNQLS